MNRFQQNMLHATDVCDCGHMAKSHKITNHTELEKGIKKVKTKCRFCNCKEMSF